jgi:hypothetical protein
MAAERNTGFEWAGVLHLRALYHQLQVCVIEDAKKPLSTPCKFRESKTAFHAVYDVQLRALMFQSAPKQSLNEFGRVLPRSHI